MERLGKRRSARYLAERSITRPLPYLGSCLLPMEAATIFFRLLPRHLDSHSQGVAYCLSDAWQHCLANRIPPMSPLVVAPFRQAGRRRHKQLLQQGHPEPRILPYLCLLFPFPPLALQDSHLHAPRLGCLLPITTYPGCSEQRRHTQFPLAHDRGLPCKHKTRNEANWSLAANVPMFTHCSNAKSRKWRSFAGFCGLVGRASLAP